MTLLHAEWMKLTRSRSNVAVILVALALLLLSAIDAGSQAARYRERIQNLEHEWAARLGQLRRDPKIIHTSTESPANSTAVFEFGRNQAPAAPRPALGGLSLSSRNSSALPSAVRVTLESRYIDARRMEAIESPLISALGLPDFSVTVALLLPLLIIALSYGLVHEAREQGVWRLLLAQTSRPSRVLWNALLLRWLVAVALVAVATTLAFSLDPGATVSAWFAWMLGVCVCASLWVAATALVNLLRISAASAALSLLSVWLVTTLVVPAIMVEIPKLREATRSELAVLRDVREIQQQAESHEHELVAQWYRDHPEHVPQSITTHAFPVTFVPKYLEQDRHLIPMMRSIQKLRSHRATELEPWMGLSPGPALVLLADHLAGSSVLHQTRYIEAITELEQRWREVLIPAVMSYQGLNVRQLRALGELRLNVHPQSSGFGIVLSLVAATVLLSTIVMMRRKSLLAP